MIATDAPRLRVSDSNNKLGRIPNLSTIPVKDCGNHEACAADCYALKAWKQYRPVREAWKANSKLFRNHRTSAFRQLGQWFERKRKAPPLFRIHVAGDFLDQEHVDCWSEFARQHPETRFLAFTKMHELDYSARPENLQIVLSMWTGLKRPQQSLPLAWVDDGVEDRVPPNAFECPGHCASCRECWDPQTDIVFRLH